MKLHDLTDILARIPDGIDEIAVIPPADLTGALNHTIALLSAGYIPQQYRWTPEKTAYAYSYKSYGRWVKSIIVAAKYYFTDEAFSTDPGRGRIARFSWRNNYGYLRMKLTRLIDYLQDTLHIPVRRTVLSNYTAIPEKPLFMYARAGEIGKNSVLIHRRMGSMFVVGEALTDIEVSDLTDQPVRKPDFSICGECRICIDACPTGAIVSDGVIDINRCFQYMSENLVVVPREIRNNWGNRLYGCSICIDVCPYNRNLKPNAEKHMVGFVGQDIPLLDLLGMSDRQWYALFQNNQIGIRKRSAIEKNVLLSLGCLQYRRAEDILKEYMLHEQPVVRISAAWSLGRLNTRGARSFLKKRLIEESEASVREEIELSIAG